MANNPYVNKVVYGNDTIMDISDTNATESDVVSGKTFYKGSGARATGSAVIPDISNCYQTTDTAETDLADADYIPFYDSSASGKRKSLWSNIKAKLKTYFDGIYTTDTITDEIVKDTVGWIGKNIADTSKAELGVAWNGNIVSNKGRLVIPCKPSTSYIISVHGTNNFDPLYYGLSASIPCGSVAKIDPIPKTITTGANDIYITITLDKTSPTQADVDALKLMVREASISDSTYEPYHKTVEEVIEQVYADNGILGAKNFNNGDAGFTFIKSSARTHSFHIDKDLNVGDKISVVFDISNVSGFTTSLPFGVRIGTTALSDNLYADITQSKVRLEFTITTASQKTESNNDVYMFINNNEDASATLKVSNVMVILPTDTDSTYQPYAMTNKELTDSKANASDLDGWTATSQVANEQVTFTGLDDTQGWGYDPRIWIDDNSTNLNPYCKINSMTGAGTANMSITYDTDADNGAYVKLRILK